MATVKDILATKGSTVWAVRPDATAHEAAVQMNERKVGGLVVKDGEQVCGIITERDILRKVVAERRDPSRTPVQEIMTRDVICCEISTPLDEAKGVMKHRRIRHLPVVEKGGLCGMISIGDLNAYDTVDQEKTIHYLQAYINGYI
jgi:CBS domain-containing protein